MVVQVTVSAPSEEETRQAMMADFLSSPPSIADGIIADRPPEMWDPNFPTHGTGFGPPQMTLSPWTKLALIGQGAEIVEMAREWNLQFTSDTRSDLLFGDFALVMLGARAVGTGVEVHGPSTKDFSTSEGVAPEAPMRDPPRKLYHPGWKPRNRPS